MAIGGGALLVVVMLALVVLQTGLLSGGESPVAATATTKIAAAAAPKPLGQRIAGIPKAVGEKLAQGKDVVADKVPVIVDNVQKSVTGAFDRFKPGPDSNDKTPPKVKPRGDKAVANTDPKGGPKAKPPGKPSGAAAGGTGTGTKATPTASTGKPAPAVKPRQVVRREVADKKQVQRGDYLRNIARKYYGDERLWPLIWEYNKARSKQSGQKLTDPDVIHPGWVFVMPKVDKSKPAK